MKPAQGRLSCRRSGLAASGMVGALVFVTLLVACARMSPIVNAPSLEAGCERFFAELDALTDRVGLRDAGADWVAGAPYLRSDRFLASFVGDALSEAEMRDWLERLRLLDAKARRAEIANIGSVAVARAVFSPLPALDPDDVVQECGRRLRDRDRSVPARVERLRQAVAVPDAYSVWHRVIGLYPLASVALEQGVAALHRKLRGTFALPLAAIPQQGERIRYASLSHEDLSHEALALLLSRASQNALDIPNPLGHERQQLFDAFAPIWEVDTVSAADRIGAIGWREDFQAEVRTETPVVYRFVTHARFGRSPLLQLNYLIWFPSRPAQGWLDLYAGTLDGLIWRVTLAPDGKPIAYDSIHPCGCYYQIFPGLGYRVQQPTTGSEPVLSPSPLLEPPPGQRLVVRLSSGEHYIQAVYPDQEDRFAERYGWRDHDGLLSLPGPKGEYRSLFGRDGLVGQSRRLERFLLWPSGVPSPGAMRRIGTHAIALIGRRHFDDARLLESLLRRL